MSVRLTDRCLDLLRLRRAARWLTTGQVRRRSFQHTTVDAVHKRLRKPTRAQYLTMVREYRMAQAMFTPGPEGKRVLERGGAEEIILERRPPKQLEHFTGINDLRIAAEQSNDLTHFFACWELPALGWSHPIVPDAVFSLGHRTFAVEFGRGREGIRYFTRTKLAVCQRGLVRLPRAIGVPSSSPLLNTLRNWDTARFLASTCSHTSATGGCATSQNSTFNSSSPRNSARAWRGKPCEMPGSYSRPFSTPQRSTAISPQIRLARSSSHRNLRVSNLRAYP